MATSVSWKMCKYGSCTKPRYKEPSGFTHEFCGRTHADMWTKEARSRYTYSPIPSTSTHLASSSKSKKSSGPLKAFQSFVKPSKSNEIKFYNRFDDYYEFTNFYPVSIRIDGLSWPSSEHYFQAQKFVGTPFVEKMRKMSSARETFQFSRNPAVSRWQRSDWEHVKDDIMLKALRCKFGQWKGLCSLLLNTGDKKLIEHTENDSYWGDGGNGRGLNKLGHLLMQVRGELQLKQPSVSKENSKSLLKRRNSLSFPTKKESKPKYADDMEISSKPPKTFYNSLRRSGSFHSLSASSPTSNYVLSTGKTSTQNSSRYHSTYSKPRTALFTPTPVPTPAIKFSPRGNDSRQMRDLLSCKSTRV